VSSQGDRPGHDGATGRHVAEIRPLTSVRTRQEHIAYVAGKYTDSPLTTLSHHLDMLWMREAFSRVKRDSAPGIDGVTVAHYAENLEANLAELLELAKSGRYRTPPVKRAYIPKNEKETSPIGLPTLTAYCTSYNSVLERHTDFTAILDELQTHSNNSFSLSASSLIQ